MRRFPETSQEIGKLWKLAGHSSRSRRKRKQQPSDFRNQITDGGQGLRWVFCAHEGTTMAAGAYFWVSTHTLLLMLSFLPASESTRDTGDSHSEHRCEEKLNYASSLIYSWSEGAPVYNLC